MAFDGIAISVDWRLVYPIPVRTIFENCNHQYKQRELGISALRRLILRLGDIAGTR